MVLATLLHELVTRFDRFEPAGPARHLYSNFVNGLGSIPVNVYPRRSTMATRAAPAGVV